MIVDKIEDAEMLCDEAFKELIQIDEFIEWKKKLN